LYPHIFKNYLIIEEMNVEQYLFKEEAVRGEKAALKFRWILILCKELINKCGGEIHIKSKPGKGSVFSILVPNHPE